MLGFQAAQRYSKASFRLTSGYLASRQAGRVEWGAGGQIPYPPVYSVFDNDLFNKGTKYGTHMLKAFGKGRMCLLPVWERAT